MRWHIGSFHYPYTYIQAYLFLYAMHAFQVNYVQRKRMHTAGMGRKKGNICYIVAQQKVTLSG